MSLLRGDALRLRGVPGMSFDNGQQLLVQFLNYLPEEAA